MAKNKQKEPLFYIQQPQIQFPKVNMQDTYSSRKAEMQKKIEKAQLSETNTNLKEGEKQEKQSGKFFEEELKKPEKLSLKPEKVQEVINEFETKRVKKEETFSFQTARRPAFKRLKGFKEMDVSEQLQYLAEFPKQLPPVPCNFDTEEHSLKGILKSKTDESIEIMLLSGEIEIVPIWKVRSIKMLGLNK